jgi:protease-4
MLASMADEVWLDRDGMLLLEGYARYRQYYAEGLDKLGVDVNLFRVGEYKSAMEPFIRNDMSEADRRATEAWLGDLWQSWLDRAALHRGLPVEVLVELTEDFSGAVAAADGDLAAMALDRGLVDRLVSRPEMRAELANRGASDPDSGFRQIDFETYAAASREWHPRADRVGIIVAQGAITEGNQPQGTIGSESTSRLIRQAARDDRIKAVVLRIDSGGGSAFASEIIRNELMALREAGKPVVVSMSNVAASGGYWIAMGADEIWAYPTTLTGSIGIFGFLPTFQDTLAKIGIHTDGIGTTPLAGTLRADRALQEPARVLIQNFIEHGYREFINLVAEYRHMSPDEVDQVAQGRVWTGAQAQRRGLVDQLGTLEEAVASAARSAGLGEDYQVEYVERKLSAFEQFFVDMAGASIRMAGIDGMRGMASFLPVDLGRQVLDELRLVFAETRTGRPGIMAHCLCEAPR